ncbi:hypothetical protein AB0J74_35310 [Asanoa sp. NPDC049573]|uniref:hypothetical protein n=1 Tax=Asanoa sp. NPDC049573 TaxID=3155396 RepID=UPI00341B688F
MTVQSVTKRLLARAVYRTHHSNERGFAMSLFGLLGGALNGVVGIVGGLLTGLGGLLF